MIADKHVMEMENFRKKSMLASLASGQKKKIILFPEMQTYIVFWVRL